MGVTHFVRWNIIFQLFFHSVRQWRSCCTYCAVHISIINRVWTWTRALCRGHSLSQHTQFLKNNMIAENDFFLNFDTINRTNTFTSCSLRAHENFRKKSVSQSTRNALKRIKMQKKIFYPFDRLRALRVPQSPSGIAQ